ncbi:MAG: hypothetical protein U0694_05570 [Anaerolineae bacterium]
MNLDNPTLYWIAGLLEGEGYFGLASYRGTNSTPNIAINMTDVDVIARVASIWGVQPVKVHAQQIHWHDTYLARLRGAKADQFMHLIFPMMGQRRQAQIKSVLQAYAERRKKRFKLTEEQVKAIKARIARGETAKSIARDFPVSHYAIWDIRSGKTWDDLDEMQAHHTETPAEVDYHSIHWLAGLLEGEGSFLAPPPSSPNTPAITISMTDEDIIRRVSAIFGTKHHQVSARREGAKTPYTAHLRGKPAIDLMRLLYPLLGKRRQTQIDRVLQHYNPYNPHRHLTVEQAKGIKQMLADSHSMRYIASEFDTTYDIVRDIKRGRCYREVEL